MGKAAPAPRSKVKVGGRGVLGGTLMSSPRLGNFLLTCVDTWSRLGDGGGPRSGPASPRTRSGSGQTRPGSDQLLLSL